MKIFVTVPTYNEAENIQTLITEILIYCPQCEIVVIDDNSPDGTAGLVEAAAKRDPRVHLLLRRENRGRGLAGIAGFQYALNRGADIIVEMDADFSHHPRYLPLMIKEMDDFDVVLGSRFIQGGSDTDRTLFRQFLTFCANAYIRMMLGIKVHDCNSGFRCFRREALEAVGLDRFISVGPSIVQELLFHCSRLRMKILEIPIEFKNRKKGETKLTSRQLLQGFSMVLKFRLLSLMATNTRAKTKNEP